MAFQGFDNGTTETPSKAAVFSYFRKNSAGTNLPLLILLHGYPQNHLMWKDFVKEIPSQYEILVPDLPGYGNSTKPVSPDSRNHSKREWAKDIVAVVDAIWGNERTFIAYGHDRGARLAYRLALDYPQRVEGAGLLDIVPTAYVWDAMRLEKEHLVTRSTHHWIFLASPRPLPETLIASNPKFYFDFTIVGWAGARAKDASLDWIQDGIEPYFDPERGQDRIIAVCEDYRAGATLDISDDFASNINPLAPPPAGASPPFSCRLLVLFSAHRRRHFDVYGIWQKLGKPGYVQSYQIGDEETGHFLVNEAHDETARRTTDWLAEHWGR